MAFFLCPPEDLTPLTPVAQDFCPFPDYNPSPLFLNMLSINSSLHLKDHYTAVQSSLTPRQLEDFTRSLRTTFGREGRVTLGGVGVVALSLAVLFDTLAKQVRGEWVSDSGPIPGLFFKDLRGNYPPHVYTISEYLRLVPHIANNPTRMREETERYFKQLTTDDQSLDKLEENLTIPINEDITTQNLILAKWFENSLRLHFLRIKNPSADELVNSNDRRLRNLVFNLNCDPEGVDKDFLAEIQKSNNRTEAAFKRYMSIRSRETWLAHVAELELLNSSCKLYCAIGNTEESVIVAQREDFDLKANALGKWAE